LSPRIVELSASGGIIHRSGRGKKSGPALADLARAVAGFTFGALERAFSPP
jgi:hypothetical protein